MVLGSGCQLNLHIVLLIGPVRLAVDVDNSFLRRLKVYKHRGNLRVPDWRWKVRAIVLAHNLLSLSRSADAPKWSPMTRGGFIWDSSLHIYRSYIRPHHTEASGYRLRRVFVV